MKHAVQETAYPPNRTCVWYIVSSISQYLLYYQQITDKHALLCLCSVKIFLNFGHSAAPNAQNYYVAALVLYGTQASVRGLNQ